MKRYMILAALLVVGLASANNADPKLEAYGNLVKATYYYANGQVQQTGFFKDGKLEGQWVAYDEQGNKKSVGEYRSGEKTGKWVFFGDKTLAEVNYQSNKIISVKNWKEDALANRN